jgi:peptidoglycan/LPS O-acetylase OafA/YrhL
MLLPAAAVFGAFLGRSGTSPRWAWAMLALGWIAGMLVRATIWHDGQGAANWLHYYYKYVYYSSWCRCDELLAGVALALLRNRHGGAWQRVLAHGNRLLAAGAAAIAAAFHWFVADHYGLWTTVFGYPLLALGFSLLILAALAPGSLLYRLRVPGAASLALWSYAIYLVHKQVSVMLAKPLAAAGYGPEHLLTIALCMLASVLAGWLMYRLVETPFMRLRARWVPDNAPVRQSPAEAEA